MMECFVMHCIDNVDVIENRVPRPGSVDAITGVRTDSTANARRKLSSA